MKNKMATKVVLAIMLCVSMLFFCVPIAVNAQVYKQGMNGQEIRNIQQKLQEKGYYNDGIDGVFGSRTKTAVIAFQKASGLVADGIVGSKTLSALGITTSSGGSYNQNDIYLLAKVIHAEARGEPYSGQVAVGAVVLNRVKHADFPNTVSGVVYQPWAFTAVNDGQINLSANDTAYKAAKDAMNGWDPTYGCIYYYNPAVATNQWIFSRPTVITIGRHVFAK